MGNDAFRMEGVVYVVSVLKRNDLGRSGICIIASNTQKRRVRGALWGVI